MALGKAKRQLTFDLDNLFVVGLLRLPGSLRVE